MPDVPTSLGEYARVLPAPFARVPEEQILQVATRKRRLFEDRSLDEAVGVQDGDVVCVPRCFHPVAAGVRHDLYYLNAMAGPVREWCITVDPAYA